MDHGTPLPYNLKAPVNRLHNRSPGGDRCRVHTRGPRGPTDNGCDINTSFELSDDCRDVDENRCPDGSQARPGERVRDDEDGLTEAPTGADGMENGLTTLRSVRRLQSWAHGPVVTERSRAGPLCATDPQWPRVNPVYCGYFRNPSRACPAENRSRGGVLSGLGALVTTPLRSLVTRASQAPWRCIAQQYPVSGWICAPLRGTFRLR